MANGGRSTERIVTAASRTRSALASRHPLRGSETSLDGAVRSYGAIVATAFVLVSVVLVWWMEPFTALRTAAIAAVFSLVGVSLLRACALEQPSILASGALALVVAAAVLSLGALAMGLLGLPVAAATVTALGLTVAVAAALAAHRRARNPESARRSAGTIPRPLISHRPSRAALVGCVVLSAPVLLVLSHPIHQAALALYVGALIWVLAVAPGQASNAGRVTGSAGARARRLVRDASLISLLSLLVLLATRLLPFLRSPVPLGYDTGLYRGVQRDFVEALPSLPVFAPNSWGDVQPAGLFMLSNLLHLAGGTPEAMLWSLLILAQLIGAIGIWMVGWDIAGRRAANWALALFVLSSAQYVLFYQVYFKQALSLAFLPYLLWLWKRESWLAIPVGAFIAATHTMGFLLMGLILLSDFLWLDRNPFRAGGSPWNGVAHVIRERWYRVIAGASILIVGLLSYAFAPRAITEFVSGDLGGTLAAFGIGGDAGQGSYRIDSGYYAWLVLPLIPFAALAVAQHWRDPQSRLVLLWAAWAAAFVMLDLIFGRRFLGSLDPAFLVLAAVSIAQLTAGPLRGAIRPFVAIALVMSTFFLARAMNDLVPEIPRDDLRDLEVAGQALPADAYIMAVSGADMPWVRGYGHRDTIAPGFLEHDRWTRAEWSTFWAPREPQDRYALLAEYDRPIYVFMRAGRPVASIAEDERFQRVSSTLWRYLPPAAATSRTVPGTPAGHVPLPESSEPPAGVGASEGR